MSPTAKAQGTTSARRVALRVAVAASALLVGAPAAASEREACVSAAERAQVLRDGNKYRQAREQLLVCSRDVCPAVVKRDCASWLNQLETVTPTVVFAAKQGSRDLTDVKVSVDGVLLTESLDGTPIPMDPGPHTFRFEWARESREEKVVVGAGQKGRNIVTTFDAAVVAAPSSAPAPAPASDAPSTKRGSLVPAVVAGGVGVLGLASFAVFGLSGSSEADGLEKTCKPRCTDDQVSGPRTKFLIADISLGVGLVALGVSTYLFLRRPKLNADERPVKSGMSSVRFDVGPSAGGGVGVLSARF